MKRKFLPLFLTVCLAAFLLGSALRQGAGREFDGVRIQDNQAVRLEAAQSDAAWNFESETPQTDKSAETRTDESETPQTNKGAKMRTDESETPQTDEGAEMSALSAFPGYAFPSAAQSFGYAPFYRIPFARYQAMYGEGLLSKTLYGMDFQAWQGAHYGMSASAGLFFPHSGGMPIESFHPGAAGARDLTPQDRNERLNLSVTEFIEMMKLSAKSPVVSKAALENANDLAELAEAIKDPAILCAYPGAISDGQGRALLCWRAGDMGESGRKLYVYDPDFPQEHERSLLLIANENGQYIGWRYSPDGNSEWGSESGGAVTFIPYSVIRAAWLARGRPQRETVLLTANVRDATIYDSSDNVVAVFRNGKVIRRTEDACPLLPLSGSASNGLAVWLPTNEVYSVVNDSHGQEALEARLVNIRQSVSVRTTAKSVFLSAEDETVSSFVRIPGAGCNYEARLLSDLDSEFPDIRIKGMTQEDEEMTAFHYAGTLHILGIQKSGTLYINGSERSPDDYSIPLINENSAVKNFWDVSKEQYYYQPIQWALSKDITNGTSSDAFSPDMTCSRAHILTFLWRANGCPEPSVSNPFSDVSASIYYAKAAAWAYETGMTSGAEFRGETPCSRSEAVVYLWKLAASPDAAPVSFRDVSPEAAYSTAVSWAVEQGITKGVTPDSFLPDAICTRGHIITFLYRYFTTEDESLTASNYEP